MTKDLKEAPFLILRKINPNRCQIKGSKNYTDKKRTDKFGMKIIKNGKHHVSFNENVQLKEVENWKALNVIPEDLYKDKKKCC